MLKEFFLVLTVRIENRRVEPEDEADADGEDEHADAPLESGVAA